MNNETLGYGFNAVTEGYFLRCLTAFFHFFIFKHKTYTKNDFRAKHKYGYNSGRKFYSCYQNGNRYHC